MYTQIHTAMSKYLLLKLRQEPVLCNNKHINMKFKKIIPAALFRLLKSKNLHTAQGTLLLLNLQLSGTEYSLPVHHFFKKNLTGASEKFKI
jgi:hypothetical protein